jgi:ABC-type transport system involved in cytochrome bd biosynthesis fused ATPase/permease subunit
MQLQASGSGKSTLASLLLRVYPVEDGRILIDGYDVRDLDAGSVPVATHLAQCSSPVQCSSVRRGNLTNPVQCSSVRRGNPTTPA